MFNNLVFHLASLAAFFVLFWWIIKFQTKVDRLRRLVRQRPRMILDDPCHDLKLWCEALGISFAGNSSLEAPLKSSSLAHALWLATSEVVAIEMSVSKEGIRLRLKDKSGKAIDDCQAFHVKLSETWNMKVEAL